MNHKQIKKKIKNSIHIESKDFLNELLEYPVEGNQKRTSFQWKSLGTIMVLPLLVLVVFISKNIWNHGNTNFDNPSMQDEIRFNEISYNVKIGEKEQTGIDNVPMAPYAETLESVNQLFHLNLSETLLDSYDVAVACYRYVSSGKLNHCNILMYSSNNYTSEIHIGIQENELPIFVDETFEAWESQSQFDRFYVSTINKTRLVLVKNIDIEPNNFKTKFKKDNLGIAINSYNVDEEEFINIVKMVIDS